jgi:DNA-binding MarR family transcriptional regulator
MKPKRKNEQQDLVEDVDFQLWRTLDSARYMIFRRREMELARIGLTPEQAVALDIVQANGGSSTINQIVSMTQRQHNSISTLVDRMARQGMVRKTRGRKDRRTLRISMTAKGEDLFGRMPRESVRIAFSCLESNEKRDLTEYLDRVLTNVYASIGVESPFPARRAAGRED